MCAPDVIDLYYLTFFFSYYLYCRRSTCCLYFSNVCHTSNNSLFFCNFYPVSALKPHILRSKIRFLAFCGKLRWKIDGDDFLNNPELRCIALLAKNPICFIRGMMRTAKGERGKRPEMGDRKLSKKAIHE